MFQARLWAWLSDLENKLTKPHLICRFIPINNVIVSNL